MPDVLVVYKVTPHGPELIKVPIEVSDTLVKVWKQVVDGNEPEGSPEFHALIQQAIEANDVLSRAAEQFRTQTHDIEGIHTLANALAREQGAISARLAEIEASIRRIIHLLERPAPGPGRGAQ